MTTSALNSVIQTWLGVFTLLVAGVGIYVSIEKKLAVIERILEDLVKRYAEDLTAMREDYKSRDSEIMRMTDHRFDEINRRIDRISDKVA